ncbi:tail fiber [Escherichia phage AV109]|nr:tail fiber [Escherichia phage AV109]WPK34986.1 tail fiber [Escherichia phage AV114]
MATLKQIQFKRSKVAGVNPTAAQLAEGELAINLKDRTLFTKDDLGNIISLGFAKGGDINGNVTQTGDYLQNGTYNLNGNQFVYAGKYIEFLPKTTGNGAWANQHSNKAPIFTDLSSTTSVSEYHPLIKQRYKDGTFSAGTLVNEGSFKFHYIDETGTSKYWTFNRNGNFQVDSGSLLVSNGYLVTQSNIETKAGSLIGPKVITKNINVSTKSWDTNIDTAYDLVSLPTWHYTPTETDLDTNGINYLRKFRGHVSSAIFHEVADARSGKPQNISYWTGRNAEVYQWSYTTDGRMSVANSIGIGLADVGDQGRYPLVSFGKGIAIGDNDTGIKWVRDGVIDLIANGVSTGTINSTGVNSTKKLTVGYSRDSGSTWDYPNTNQAMFSARTEVDGNNNGDGQTHIGYSSNAKMYHYFRGAGRMAISMGEGLIVEPGILDIKTGSNSLNLRADGTIASVQTLKLNNGLYFNGDGTNASLIFKAASGIDGTKQILWEGGTRAGQNKSYVTVKAWGNSFNATGDKARETVFEVSDGQGYYFYSQRVAPTGSETTGPVVTQFNGQVNARGSLITDGSLRVNGLSTLVGNVTMNNGLFVQGGSSITGQVKIGGTADALRIWNAEYGAIFRRSEDKLYIIPTPQNAGESGGISNLRPFYIALSNGKVSMDHDVDIGGGRFKVEAAGTTAGQRITVNMASDAIRINAPTQESSNFIQGRKADVPKWYLGIGDGGNVVRMHSYTYSHGIALNSDSVDITKPLKVGNAQLGTDGNITGGSGNFANLNTALNRKVNSGFVTYGATAGWYKFATVTMPQSTSTVSFTVTGGKGFNTGLFTQCAITEIVLRTGNDHPIGLNAVMYTRTAAGFTDIAVVNTSGNTYDVYVESGTYANQLAYTWHAVDNATVKVIGAFGPTQDPVDSLPVDYVKGQVANMLNNLVDTGKVKRYEADSEIAINNPTGIRIRSNYDKTGSVATMLRNDGGSFYILFTDKNATDGAATVNGDWNSKRPFAINLTTGEVIMNNGIAVRSAALFYNSINVKDNGSINFDKSGANPRNMRIFHAGDGTRGNRLEISDETNYIAYFQKLPGGQNQVSFNSATLSGLTQCNQFGVNTTNALGGNSITFGDNDTGIKQNGDGLLDIYANNVQVFRFQNGDLYSYKNINAPNVYIRSDIRLKSNFKPIENALDKVEKLNGVIYDKAEYIGGEAIETEAGIVAQTLQDVLPEAVRETEDSKGNKILTVSSQAQIALLVEAVKTLSSRVKELESKLM